MSRHISFTKKWLNTPSLDGSLLPIRLPAAHSWQFLDSTYSCMWHQQLNRAVCVIAKQDSPASILISLLYIYLIRNDKEWWSMSSPILSLLCGLCDPCVSCAYKKWKAPPRCLKWQRGLRCRCSSFRQRCSKRPSYSSYVVIGSQPVKL